jgi:multiple sugar transport system substrate-binding protein
MIGLPDQFRVLSEALARSGLACRLYEMTWDRAWTALAEFGLYRYGPDVSMVGSTWLESIVATDAVRPFSDQDIESLGGESVFLPAIWQTVRLLWGNKMGTWAIPWVADVRVIYYWRDMLEQAGVDEETAFQTPERVEETAARLRASDVEVPWSWWADTYAVTLQNASSWVWGAGGDYVSADGKQILFNQPEALRGLVAYLNLHRYMPPDTRRVDSTALFGSFINRRIAVTMGPSEWLPRLHQTNIVPDAPARLGVAAPPGPAFVGGTSLVVWQHSRHLKEALELVRFLTGKQVQSDCVYRTRPLSVRQDVLAEPPYTTDAHYQVITGALRSGRTYPVVPRWGAVEKMLGEALVWLWNGLLANPDQDVEAIAVPYLDALAQRLAVTLGSRG